MFGSKGTTIGCWLVWCYIFLTYHVVSEAPANVNGMTRSPFQTRMDESMHSMRIMREIDTEGEKEKERQGDDPRQAESVKK